jgi:transcriptional regulator with XRE-family HTH domain
MDAEEVALEGPWLVAAGTPGNVRFGSLFKQMREQSGLSPQVIADLADVHVSFVRGIERGAQAPSIAKARPLLAGLNAQDRVQWTDEGPYDLLLRDPESGHQVAFEFKARVKGQNKRTDSELPDWNSADFAAAATVISLVMENIQPNADLQGVSGSIPALIRATTEALPRIDTKTMSSLMQGVALGLSLPTAAREAAAADQGLEENAEDVTAATAHDRLGRVVRLLATADQETLERVERLLVGD